MISSANFIVLGFLLMSSVAQAVGSAEAIAEAIRCRSPHVVALVRSSDELTPNAQVEGAPLMVFAIKELRENSFPVVQALLGKDLDPTLREASGLSALESAVVVQDERAVNLLLKKLKQLNQRADRQHHFGPLHCAVEKSNLYLVKRLICEGLELEEAVEHRSIIDINGKDREGNTALMLAVEKKLISMVELLVQTGADLELRNHQGLSALDYAHRVNSRYIVEILEGALKTTEE